jgi:hypothetical protein
VRILHLQSIVAVCNDLSFRFRCHDVDGVAVVVDTDASYWNVFTALQCSVLC